MFNSKRSFVFFLGGISWHVVTGSLFVVEELLGSSVSLLLLTLESVELDGSGKLGSLYSLGSLGLDGGGSSLLSLSLSSNVELVLLNGEWVKSVHEGTVVKWVLLGLVMSSHGGSNFSKLGLNLIGVDDSGKIGAGHHVSVQGVSGLLNGVSEVGSEKAVEGLEGASGENNESSEVTTWSELDDVESVDVASINSWEVSSGLGNFGALVSVDDEWTSLQDVSGVSELSLSGS